MTHKANPVTLLASPLGEEGHEVAKGWTVVRMIMTLDMDVTAERRHYNTHCSLKGKRLTTFCASLRSRGRRLAVRIAMEHPIGTLPRTPFCLFEAFPLKGKRGIWREKQGVIYFMYHSGAFPLWCLTAPPFPRSSVGRQKESALMGRLGALLRPTWRSYAGPPQWHYKAPLCCERLMKGLLCGVLFFPLNRGGKSGEAG